MRRNLTELLKLNISKKSLVAPDQSTAAQRALELHVFLRSRREKRFRRRAKEAASMG